jgi:hypothetical protein
VFPGGLPVVERVTVIEPKLTGAIGLPHGSSGKIRMARVKDRYFVFAGQFGGMSKILRDCELTGDQFAVLLLGR